MTNYTLSHWGTYEVEPRVVGPPALKPFKRDRDPSPIGLHQLDPALDRLRVRRPAVRKSWLDNGPSAATERRGLDPFVEVEWERALNLVAGEIERVRTAHGNSAIFGGSYGWSSAGRFHHAQNQVHRFLNAAGGYVRHVDSYSLGAANVVLPHVVATMDDLMASHNSWDVLATHCDLFVTFGGVPVKNAQMNDGGVGLHGVPTALAGLRAAGTQLVNIGPARDNIGAVGDVATWIPCRPNTDTAVMLALAWVLFTEGRCLAAIAITDDMMPGVARLNTGAWFDPDPTTGLEKHGNPNVLTLDVPASGLSQGCSAQTCLIEIAAFTGPVPPVTAFCLPEFELQ